MSDGSGLLVIERILRDRDGIWNQIGEERSLGKLTRDLLLSSSAALACYGAVLGASNTDQPVLQALVSAVKLPLLFLMTLAICLPTLYLFNLVFGARLQVRQALALVLVAITVIATLSFAFAPISLFFLVTANHYAFYKLLNVAILTLTALVGLRFLTAGMAALNRHNEERRKAEQIVAPAMAPAVGPVPAPVTTAEAPIPAQLPAEAQIPAAAPVSPAVPALVPAGAPMIHQPYPGPAQAMVGNGVMPAGYPVGQHYPGMPMHPQARQYPVPVAAPPEEKQASMSLLYVWILLFGFVGTQLAWTLRPFFGSPGEKFELFRSIDGNFYVDIIRTLTHF